jgi:hypothetical protein
MTARKLKPAPAAHGEALSIDDVANFLRHALAPRLHGVLDLSQRCELALGAPTTGQPRKWIMPSVPPYVQEISLNRIRQQVVLVGRGYGAVAWIAASALVFLLSSIVRDLPLFDAAKLVSPELWVWAGLGALVFLVSRACPGPSKRMIGGLFALQTLLLLAVGSLYGPDIHINFAQIGRMPVVAGLLVLWPAVMLYWLALSPAIAAIRLLAIRLPPDDVPLLTAMATLDQTKTRPRGLPSRIAAYAQALKAVACLTGLAGAVAALRLMAEFFQDENQVLAGLAGLAIACGTPYVVAPLWRRGRRLAAVDANEQLKHDPRAPVLYLRSFQDDSELLEGTEIFPVLSGAPSAKLEKRGALARFLNRPPPGQGRLEEVLARHVRGIGPFVAIGAPTEPLPELGAARAYFSDDTWQSAIIRWIDFAGLIILAVGPTKWIRWELDAIIERDALCKFIILMPPGLPDDRAARWQNVTSGLQPTRWGSSLAMVNYQTVIAVGFFDDGGLSIVTGGKKRVVDYLLAFRLMLYQLKKSSRGLNL